MLVNIFSWVISIILKLISLILTPFVRLLKWSLGDKLEEWDKEYRYREDFYVIPFFLKQVFLYALNVRKKRFQSWYNFENQVKINGNCKCIRYARPSTTTKGEFTIETFTYKDTYDIVLRLSYILHYHYKVQPGSTVGIDSTNKPLFMFLWLALWNIGAVPAFLNYNVKGAPLVNSIKVADITQIFIEPDAMGPIRQSEEEIKNALSHVKLNYLDEQDLMSQILNPTNPQFLQEHNIRSPDDLTDFKPAMLIYTSGTTGLPKAAILSWRKANIGCLLFGHVMHMDTSSVVFTAMPLFHSTAALLGACAVLSKGGCLSLANKFSASSFWKQVYMSEATHIQYVGEVCRYLLHTPVSKYEKMHTATYAYGNGLRPDIWQEFRKRFNIEVIGEFYAATEAPFATTTLQRGTFGLGACRSYGSIVNWFLSFQQTLVKMDPDDEYMVYRNSKGFCETAAVGESGEMLMKIFFPKKPETSFQGYLGNKKDTESKVLRNVFRNGDAWYRCGDLLRSDEYGLWYFVDRLGDTFRWKSENVSTTEVEDQLAATDESLCEQIVVVGIKVPGYEGRAGFALLKLTESEKNKYITDESKVKLLNNTLKVLNAHLPKYALPIFVKFVDKFEMTDTSKIRKALYRNQKLPYGADGTDTLYWLKDYKEYKLLTSEDWRSIEGQTFKL
ncbi:hypothetical protein Kpol_1036p7 [Vanderwaltozyma polyspora DSM 70294]|uniref:Very long-chain fatty acid transport protein n=1 Tax=Vanderwaltozyma polyspora (strain ATCC 22028 / DSM 70294 / BCRC 21397 / CBS 2163 / NBRC 10782 / NRRL Y-8283 / UCD 57-17) TaxID=436907 RepID=A7TEF8_VANPO|nr:uncharacterized protein Kpol_1036p7 [Vanderwaltozyma polyspora DSM 70294]EDO19265.1 hypothetical protein Kpol_1036p7 [Vanderwaltozyma polyspora DSM 70294]